MAIIKTINSTAFSDWIKQSNDYKNNFTYEGANALQQYLEELSDDIGENIDFDPVAWCCEYSEYKNYASAYAELGDGTITDTEEQKQFIDDRTMTYEFDGGLIVQDFLLKD